MKWLLDLWRCGGNLKLRLGALHKRWHLAVAALLFAAVPAMGQSGQTFAQRCAAAQATGGRCIDFASAADISGTYGDNTGVIVGDVVPAVVNDVKPLDGAAGSLWFSIPLGFSGNTDYFANFSANLATQFDSCNSAPNSCEFYVQWRQRMDANMVVADPGPGCCGYKQAIITEGDRGPGDLASSCQDIGIVVQNTQSVRFPRIYHSCGAKDGQYEPIEEGLPNPVGNVYLENGVRSPAPCDYALVIQSGQPYIPPCVGYVAGEWTTYQMHVKVGTWYMNQCSGMFPTCPPDHYNHDTTVQMWITHPGQAPALVQDYQKTTADQIACHNNNLFTSVPVCQTGYDLVNFRPGVAKFGKIWFTPRIGNCNPPPGTCAVFSGFTGTANTWYAELIISRNRIADP